MYLLYRAGYLLRPFRAGQALPLQGPIVCVLAGPLIPKEPNDSDKFSVHSRRSCRGDRWVTLCWLNEPETWNIRMIRNRPSVMIFKPRGGPIRKGDPPVALQKGILCIPAGRIVLRASWQPLTGTEAGLTKARVDYGMWASPRCILSSFKLVMFFSHAFRNGTHSPKTIWEAQKLSQYST